MRMGRKYCSTPQRLTPWLTGMRAPPPSRSNGAGKPMPQFIASAATPDSAAENLQTPADALSSQKLSNFRS